MTLKQGLQWDLWDSVTDLETCWENVRPFFFSFFLLVWQCSLCGWKGRASSFQEKLLRLRLLLHSCLSIFVLFCILFFVFSEVAVTNPALCKWGGCWIEVLAGLGGRRVGDTVHHPTGTQWSDLRRAVKSDSMKFHEWGSLCHPELHCCGAALCLDVPSFGSLFFSFSFPLSLSSLFGKWTGQ